MDLLTIGGPILEARSSKMFLLLSVTVHGLLRSTLLRTRKAGIWGALVITTFYTREDSFLACAVQSTPFTNKRVSASTFQAQAQT